MIKNRNAIMHAHSSVYALPLFMLARRCGIKKLILHSHSTKFSSSRVKDLISKVLSEIAILYATDYWACSEEAALYMFGKNRGKSVQIMKNGIDFARFRYSVKEREEIRNKYGLSGRFVIGHVGRFSEEKNHEFIIRVFKEAKERNKEALLLLVGNGTKYNNIRKICMENQVINDVLFIGFSNNVSSLLSSMDVFLFPSIHEGLPIALLEAQANGLPCIASDQITKDVKISNHLEFMSLNQSISDWATKILDAKREFKEVEELSHLFDSIYTRMQTLERYREILSRSS